MNFAGDAQCESICIGDSGSERQDDLIKDPQQDTEPRLELKPSVLQKTFREGFKKKHKVSLCLLAWADLALISPVLDLQTCTHTPCEEDVLEPVPQVGSTFGKPQEKEVYLSE